MQRRQKVCQSYSSAMNASRKYIKARGRCHCTGWCVWMMPHVCRFTKSGYGRSGQSKDKTVHNFSIALIRYNPQPSGGYTARWHVSTRMFVPSAR